MFIVSSLITIIYGVLIWLLERKSNAEFDPGYLGAIQGLWLGIVTMTTVGFGDVKPRTWLRKLLTAMFMMFGLLGLSLLMGTIISIVQGTGNISIMSQRLVVKNNSIEQLVVEKIYGAKTIAKNTYEDVK